MSNIVIVNYGAGNIQSVMNMLKKAGAENVIISSTESDIRDASKLIVPGVGHFDHGMKQLKQSGLISVLNDEVLNKKKIVLGICLGAQLFTNHSEEGDLEGLGWINGQTIAFDKTRISTNHKIPHMGWNSVKIENHCDLDTDLPVDSRFYFVHSYHLQLSNPKEIWMTTNYGYDFASSFHKDNIYGCQFHPEKSHKYGLQLMQNFVSLK